MADGPRFVRNSWFVAKMDGRTTPIEGGPSTRDGELGLTVLVRHGGKPEESIRVRVFPNNEKLGLRVEDLSNGLTLLYREVEK
jgi:hypothetical protein